MGVDQPEPVPKPTGAVFLSYASEDAVAAERICAGLRAAGIEVWFDQSELRGGDAWDRKIRRQIHDCALFVPIISANTHARIEGYFRLEWKLAIDRSHLIAPDQTFLLPVVIDNTPQTDERIPDRFCEVQWSRLPGGEPLAAFIERVRRLLSAETSTATSDRTQSSAIRFHTPGRRSVLTSAGAWVGLSLAMLTAAYFVSVKRLRLAPAPPPTTAANTASPGPTQGTAEKSIVVLPFADMSEKKDQEYFSDGLAEELIDLLAKTPGLHVIARTSSFSFKGKSDDIPTIASKLRVSNVLEGSVRKSGNRLRVSTQLVRSADGEHLWSETYDREMKDIFKVQDEIAAAVVSALKLRLSPAQSSSPSRSANTDAYLQYLLGQQYFNRANEDSYRRSLAAYRQAITLDPSYAAAYAGLALAEDYLADATGDAPGKDRALAAAERAVALAPDQPMGYAARGQLRAYITWDWSGARADFAQALELGPDDPIVLRQYSLLVGSLGRLPEATTAARKVTEIDPFSAPAWRTLAEALFYAGDLPGGRAAIGRSLAIDPSNRYALVDLGAIELVDHRPAEALSAFRKIADDDPESIGLRLTGIALAEHSLGDARESRQALDEAIAKTARVGPYQIGQVFAWRGDKDPAFAWLERSYRKRDGWLTLLKTDPLLASLHGDPRFKAMLRKTNLQE